MIRAFPLYTKKLQTRIVLKVCCIGIGGLLIIEELTKARSEASQQDTCHAICAETLPPDKPE